MGRGTGFFERRVRKGYAKGAKKENTKKYQKDFYLKLKNKNLFLYFLIFHFLFFSFFFFGCSFALSA
jgi:hypothetical protein